MPTQSACPVVHVDHHSADFARTRHEVFTNLRRESPVVYSDLYDGFYVVTSYDIGRRVLRDDEHFAVSRFDDGTGGLLIPSVMKAPPLRPGELDGEEHLAYRKALHESFKPKTIAGLEDFIQGIIDDALDDVIAKGDFDVIADIANVIPARVVMEYLGLPSDQREKFLEGLALGFRAAPDPDESAADAEKFQESWRAMLDVVVDKRANPADDVISRLAAHEIGLTDEQLLSVILNISLGGTATTMGWFGYGTMQLQKDLEMRSRLREDVGAIPAFGEELLRYFSPASSLARNVIKEVEIGDVNLKIGDRVYVAIASLNRDDAVFTDAAQFEPDRERKQHMAFGVGAHFCMGVHLARLEFRLYIESLLKRIPDYRVDIERSEHNLTAGVTPQWRSMPATTNLEAGVLR